MRSIEIDLFDVPNTFHAAVHHLHLAAAMFDALSPEQFDAALVAAGKPIGIPHTVHEMLAPVITRMKTEAWLQTWKVQAASEMLPFALDDPAGDVVWDRYAEEITTRLRALGRSEDEIADELGDMASVFHEIREAERAPRKRKRRGKS